MNMDTQTMFEFSPLSVVIVPIVVGLVQMAKNIGLPSKYAPVLSIALGMSLVATTGTTWQAAVVQGMIIGLASSGLYSGSKKAYEEYTSTGQ